MTTRPGQVRFEAWVPETLFHQFARVVPNRKAWLVAEMHAAVGPNPEPLPVVPPHVHTRERTGEKLVGGIDVGAWRCPGCGQEW